MAYSSGIFLRLIEIQRYKEIEYRAIYQILIILQLQTGNFNFIEQHLDSRLHGNDVLRKATITPPNPEVETRPLVSICNRDISFPVSAVYGKQLFAVHPKIRHFLGRFPGVVRQNKQLVHFHFAFNSHFRFSRPEFLSGPFPTFLIYTIPGFSSREN